MKPGLDRASFVSAILQTDEGDPAGRSGRLRFGNPRLVPVCAAQRLTGASAKVGGFGLSDGTRQIRGSARLYAGIAMLQHCHICVFQFIVFPSSQARQSEL
jgi:hypothetical protein